MYGATPIKVLKGFEAVRKRPALYIGDTGDGSGLHTMVYEVVENALEEVLAGFTTEVSVTLNADGSATIRDDGRGIPIEIDLEAGISAAEVVMTQLHAGGMFDERGDGNPYKVSGGLHSVGVSVVNALSSRLDLRTWRDGKEHLVRFRDGVAEAPLRVIGPASGRHGTEVTFWPSPDVFHNVTAFDYAILEHRLRELAFLNPGLRVVVHDAREAGSKPQAMRYPNGLSDFVRHLDRARTPLLDAPLVIAGEEDGIGVEAALWWNDSRAGQVLCFTNTLPQREGGTHLVGFSAALARVLKEHAEAAGIADDEEEEVSILGEDVCEGLTAVLSVKVPDPKFSSQLKDKLVSAEVKAVVDRIVGDELAAWLQDRPEAADAILDTVVEAAVARKVRAHGQPTTAEAADIGPARKGRAASDCNATEIEPQNWLDAVRRHPSNYIGDTGDGTGLLNMVYEVLDYALDDFHRTEIAVSLNADGSATVRHNGHGFDTRIPDFGGGAQAENVATHPSGAMEFRRNRYRVPLGLERATVAAVNALSSCLEMRIWKDGQEHLLRFRDGVAEARIKAVRPAKGQQGMEVTFWPSLGVFHPVTDFDYAALERRLHEVAALNPDMRIVLDDRRPGGRGLERICHGGTADLVRFLDRSRKPLLDAPIVMRSDVEDDDWIDVGKTGLLDLDCWTGFEVALWWNNGASDQVACYTDGLPLPEGGRHRDRLLTTVGRVIARYAQQHGDAGSPKMPVIGEDARPGFTAVVALQRYAYWTPLSEEALDKMTAVVESVVADRLSAWLNKHPRQAQAILGHARKAASGRAVSGFAQRLPAERL